MRKPLFYNPNPLLIHFFLGPTCLRVDSLRDLKLLEEEHHLHWELVFCLILVRKLLPKAHLELDPELSCERKKELYGFWNLYLEKDQFLEEKSYWICLEIGEVMAPFEQQTPGVSFSYYLLMISKVTVSSVSIKQRSQTSNSTQDIFHNFLNIFVLLVLSKLGIRNKDRVSPCWNAGPHKTGQLLIAHLPLVPIPFLFSGC